MRYLSRWETLTVVILQGRVYYLHFNSFEDKYFFWMQSPEEADDKNLAKQLNELINKNTDDEGK